MATRYKTITQFVQRKLTERRTTTQLRDVLRNRHIANDIGLPYEPAEPRRIDQW